MLGKGGGNSGGKRRVRMKTSKQVSRYEAGTKQVRSRYGSNVFLSSNVSRRWYEKSLLFRV